MPTRSICLSLCWLALQTCRQALKIRSGDLRVRPRRHPPARPVGRDMLYSSGTTGHPKGIRRPLTPYEDRDKPELEIIAWRRAFGFDENTVYLSTAPFYHAAPLRYIMRTLDVGGTCVAMAKYDAEGALAAVERYRVTHSQWVPTMFVRLLGLPDETRRRYDLSSMKVAIHAAAPCPVHVKQAMLDWWGDILYEYYAGSEGAGTTSIGHWNGASIRARSDARRLESSTSWMRRATSCRPTKSA
jgi:acyl-CoA synthetase (AMP-forming)/AMP-acid ligase II